MNEIDNRTGTDPIYWTTDFPFKYGVVNPRQIATGMSEFTTYTTKQDWEDELMFRGIEITPEEPTNEP